MRVLADKDLNAGTVHKRIRWPNGRDSHESPLIDTASRLRPSAKGNESVCSLTKCKICPAKRSCGRETRVLEFAVKSTGGNQMRYILGMLLSHTLLSSR
jgi:hypothetical protein